MLKLALGFLVIGLLLGLAGFGGVGGAFVGIAKVLFFVAIALFVAFAILAVLGVRRIAN